MREIADSTGVHEIEDMWLPFFCVSSNLSRAEMKVHTRGSAVSSILASTRVPGLFPPVTWEDQLLVDGGLVNNVPVDVMRQFMNEGTIIASDVAPPVDFQANVDFGFGVSGWNLLWRRLRRASPHRNIVGVRDVLIRTIEFGGAFHAKRMKDLADLYLNMPVAQFKAGDFSRGPEIIDISYRFARDQINGWIEAKGRPWQDQGSL
jgi:predicted acylesterase/phospholipase RssA